MFVKITNGTVDKYPYSAGKLRRDNPNISFPKQISEEIMASYGVYPVAQIPAPEFDSVTQFVEWGPTPIFSEEDNAWIVLPTVRDYSEGQIAERKAQLTADAEFMRAEAYRTVSDPVFFKWQRGSATEQEWLDKIAEIKALYPDPS